MVPGTKRFLIASITAVTRSLSELENEVKAAGMELPVKYGKKELLDLLQDHFWNKSNPGQPKPQYESPQLIKNIKDLPEPEQEKIWNSPDWVAEPKRNGIRCLGYLGSSSKFTSRNVSVQDYLPESLTKALFWLQASLSDYEGTVVDGEIISTKKSVDLREFTTGKGSVTGNVLQAALALLAVERTQEAQQANGMPLRYILYDILRYKGQDIKNLPYSDRRLHLEEVFTIWQSRLQNQEALELNTVVDTNKKQFFLDCVKTEGEGCVLKYKKGKYTPGPTRTKDQLKVKRQLELDGVVTGFVPPQSGRFLKEGLVGGLVFSCKDTTDQKWYKVAAVSNISDTFRREITLKNPDGTFKGITPETYGRVFEIEGFEYNKNAQLSHAKIVRERVGADGKSPDECTFDRQAIIRQLEEEQGNA